MTHPPNEPLPARTVTLSALGVALAFCGVALLYLKGW